MNMLDHLFDWLLQASLRASILTVAVLLTQRVLRRHLSARMLHALWLPVLIVTLMPAWPRSPWSAQSLIMEARPVAMTPPSVPHTPAPVAQEASAMVRAEPVIPWTRAGTLIWAAGSVGLIIAGLISLNSNLRKFRHTACAPEAGMVDMVASLARQIGLRRRPSICQSGAISSPAVAGWLRPVLLLPASFAQTFTAREAELVLKHELMHLKRGDLFMNALLCLLMALHWFNPLLWIAFHKARIDREAACDEDVLRHGSQDERCAYGHALLKAESAFCPRGWSLGFVGIFDRGAGLRTRIRVIASPGSHHPQARLFACILIALMTYLGSTQAQPGGPEKKGAQILIDTKLGPDLGEGSSSVKSRSDVHGPAVVIDVKIIDVSALGTLKLLSTRTTLKNDLTVVGIADGQADRQVKMLTESGGTVLSAPRMYTVSGNEGRIQVQGGGKQGGDPFEKDASFVGTRCTLLPTLKVDVVNLDVDIEHVATPGQTTRFHTTETMKNGSTILLSHLQAAAGKPRPPCILITLAWNAEEGPLVKKLRSIILPRVQFREATLEEALEFFRVKARTLDTAESDATKRGVNMVLKTKQASQARISLDLANVPLEEALKYTTELANVDYWIEGSAVAITAKARTSNGQENASSAQGEAVDQAKQMILPKVQISGASIEEAVEFLSAQLRGREDKPSIHLILKPGGAKSSISLDLKDVPLWEALRYISELGNHALSADDHSIILTPR